VTRVPFLRIARRCGLASLLLVGAAAAPTMAQSITFGALSGQVQDAAGRPIADAEVRLVDRESGAERTAITSRDGRFRFGLLGVAQYDLSAEAIGYRPVVHIGVHVESGATVAVRLSLRAAAPPVVARDTVQARAATAAPLSWLVERGYGDITGSRRTIGDVATLSPFADGSGIEGLPWRLAEVVVDGSRVGGVGNPATSGAEAVGLAIPTRGLALASAGGVGFDVEMSGSGTGLVGTSTRGGANSSWRSIAEGGTAGIGAALSAGGTVQRDTAHATAGADYQRSAVITPAWFPATDALGAQIADIALNTHARDLSALTEESERLEERWSGHARFDWLQGDRFALSFRASGSRLRLGDPATLDGAASGLGSTMTATAANLSLDLLARVTRTISVETRLSGDVGEATASGALPPTAIAARGVILGAGEEEPYRDGRTTPRITGMVHWDAGAHRVKVGVTSASHRFESRATRGARGVFAFGDAIDFATLEGVYRAVAPDASASAFRLGESAVFVQDAWAVTDALTLTAGVRMDAYTLPTAGLGGTSNWVATSGLAAPSLERKRSRSAPRVGFRWSFGDDRSWVLQGGAGVFNDVPDRRDLGEAIALGRGAEVRGAVGTLGSWPSAPGATASLGQTLTLVGPEFEAPKTQRISLALQRTVGEWTSYLSAVYRHTDFLSRRNDLNLPAAPSGVDQYGRTLHGRLQQVGALLVAEPLTNRRFAGFETVQALDVNGYSDFAAISVGVDRVVERGVSLAVNYAYSMSEDNVVGNGLARLSPFAASFGGDDWSDGTSDLSVPHRGLVAVELAPTANGAFRVGMVYRVRSGSTFTPGFAPGVDANGDGDVHNDPAFIDNAIPGMDAMLAANDCLARQAGGFAARNSCRGALVQRLDLRAAFRLASGPGAGIHLVIDAMDVVSAATGRVDAALYHIDRSGALSTNALTGVTTMPLMVNPRFGELVADRSPGVLWRVGLRIGR
jgi:Carboxypeptidase regulatory-like domain/TonB dependent receptor